LKFLTISNMPEVKPEIQTFAKIKVVGVGGAGGAAVNRMIQSKIKGVEFIVIDDDLQALYTNLAGSKVHMGRSTTRGLGAGMNPAIGRKAAEESQNEIRDLLKGADLIFITCGGGGGTGSGAGPKVAEIAKEMGALTIAVVTKPFSFEGTPRRKIADEALKEFKSKVDTLITIPNDRLWQIIDKKTPLLEAFLVVDEVLRQGVQGISELITLPGLINVDFADLRTIMANSGSALMGVGISSGDNRAVEAAKAAIASPLLEISIEGAKGLLFTITGGPDLTMYEVSEAAKTVTECVDTDAKIIFGAVVDENMKDQLKVTVVATGFDEKLGGSVVKATPGFTAGNVPNYFSAHAVSSPSVNAIEKRIEEPPRNFEQKRFEQREEQKPRYERPVKEEASFEESPADDEDLEIPAFIRRKMM
jgi:cell division protein FtsZ